MSINEYDEVVAENIALRRRVAELEAEEQRSTEYLRETLRKVHEEQKGLAVCSWCALPTNADAESKRMHQMACDKSPIVAHMRAMSGVVECSGRLLELLDWAEKNKDGIMGGSVAHEDLREHLARLSEIESGRTSAGPNVIGDEK